jgi:hypothetical protein
MGHAGGEGVIFWEQACTLGARDRIVMKTTKNNPPENQLNAGLTEPQLLEAVQGELSHTAGAKVALDGRVRHGPNDSTSNRSAGARRAPLDVPPTHP